MNISDIENQLLKTMQMYGSKTAIKTSTDEWSYTRLASEVNKIQHKLHEFRGVPVFVSQTRTPQAIATYVAALLSGNYTAYLEPDASEEYRKRIINLLPSGVIIDDNLNISISTGNTDMPHIDSEAVAYSIFTSGTSGEQKCVMISRENVYHFINDIVDIYGIDSDDRIVGFADFGFDVAMYEIYAALFSGATLCLIQEKEKLDPEMIAQFIKDQEITVAELPPAILPFLKPDKLPSLRLVSVGGEQVSQQQVDRWIQYTTVFNGYGPAECTVAFTQHQYNQGDHANVLGSVVGENRFIIYDSENSKVIEQGEGELCVAGKYVGLGYSTSEFSVHQHDGLTYYRTGDIVSHHKGQLRIQGRTDDIIKRHGVRISLKEIDNAVQAATSAANVKTVLHEKMLVTFIEGRESIDSQCLRQRLEKAVGKARIPNHFVPVKLFPLTRNEKIDTRALLASFEESNQREILDNPENVKHTQLLTAAKLNNIVSDVLNVNVSPKDNIFNYGIQSVDILRLIHQVEIDFGQQLPYFEFAKNPTVAGLSAYLDSQTDPNPLLEELLPEHQNPHYPSSDSYVHQYLEKLAISGKTAAEFCIERTIEKNKDRLFCIVYTILEYKGCSESLPDYVRAIDHAFSSWATKAHYYVGTTRTSEVAEHRSDVRHVLTTTFENLVDSELDCIDCHKYGVVESGDQTYFVFAHTHTDVDGYSLGRFFEAVEESVTQLHSPVVSIHRKQKQFIDPEVKQFDLDCAKHERHLSKILTDLKQNLAHRPPHKQLALNPDINGYEFTISESDTLKINQFAAKSSSTLAAVLLHTTNQWLVNSTQNKNTAFWIPVDGRTSSVTEQLNCVASALPITLNSHDSLKDTHASLIDMKRYEEIPIELLVDGVSKIVPNDQIAIPTLFAFQNCGSFSLEESSLELGYFETLHSAPIYNYYHVLLRGLHSSFCFSSTQKQIHCRVEFAKDTLLEYLDIEQLKNSVIKLGGHS